LERKLEKTLPACGISGYKSPRRKLRFEIHQKKRKLAKLAAGLEQLENEKRISVCSGTKKLFLSQFHPEENGFQNHDEWLEEWREKRHNRIFYIGSKDETCGNQNCQLSSDGTLKIRVIPGLEQAYGKYYTVSGISFVYGQETVSEALKNHQAVNFRFVHKENNRYLFLTTEKKPAEIITGTETGAVGVDLNADHIAWAEVNRHGNLTDCGTIPVPVQDRSSEQTEAMFSDALKQITEHAGKTGKPVVIEKLDFSGKKRNLSDTGKKYSRMISGFAYALFYKLLLSKASREGVQVIAVNPAYSSVIGRYKYMQMYGISVHIAASLVLARRGLKFSERPPASYAPYLAEHKYRHVWSFWSRFSKAVSDRKIQVDISSSVRKNIPASRPTGSDVLPPVFPREIRGR